MKSPWTNGDWRDERGSMTVWVAVLLGAILVGFGGLVYDAAGAATHRSEIIDAAWSLARTGASETTSTGLIDPDAAKSAVGEAAARQWPDLVVSTTASTTEVTITVNGTYAPQLLAVIGVGAWDLTASRTSTLEP